MLLHLVAFAAVALLIPNPAYAQNLESQLAEASLNGDTEKVKALLDTGAQVNAKTESGLTALMYAADSGHADTAQVLLSRGANVNAKDKDDITVLILAVAMGHTDTVQVLLDAGVDSRDLSIAVVLDRQGDNHAVLVLRHSSGDLVLDSLSSRIRPWNRTGYTFLAMQSGDDKTQWVVVMDRSRDSNVLAQR